MLNPILSFSAARRMRSFRTMLIAVVYTVVLLIIAVLMMGRMFAGEVLLTQMSSARNCYMLLLFVQFGLLLLIGPAYTQIAVKTEKALAQLHWLGAETITGLDETLRRQEEDAYQEAFAAAMEAL